jgi:hypothetical protein
MHPHEVEARWSAAHAASERPELPTAAALKLLKQLLPHPLPVAQGVITATPSSIEVGPSLTLRDKSHVVHALWLEPCSAVLLAVCD